MDVDSDVISLSSLVGTAKFVVCVVIDEINVDTLLNTLFCRFALLLLDLFFGEADDESLLEDDISSSSHLNRKGLPKATGIGWDVPEPSSMTSGLATTSCEG
jgi:hypothetical protein